MPVDQYHSVALQQRADGALTLAFGASVLVKLSGTNTLAELFSDVDGSIPLANPFIVDPTYATIDFFVVQGRYHIILSKAGYTFPDDLTAIMVGIASLSHNVVDVIFINGQPTALAEDAIPVGARVVEVTVTNVVGPGNSQGLTSYNVGDVTVADKWGNSIPLTTGHVTDKSDYTSSDETIYPAGGDVVLTANGGNFDGTGTVSVDVGYE